MKLAGAIQNLDVEIIYVPERMRKVSTERVVALAESIKLLGILSPITIRIMPEMEIDGVIEQGVPVLIAGHHRLEAARSVGLEEVPCIEVTADDIEAQLWEIDENLARSELTTDEKRDHLRRRKALWDERERQVAHDAPAVLRDGRKSGPQHQKSFAAETAAATGLSKSQINRLIADPKPRQIVVRDEPVITKADPPDMYVEARRIAARFSKSELQLLIDHLCDLLKEREAA